MTSFKRSIAMLLCVLMAVACFASCKSTTEESKAESSKQPEASKQESSKVDSSSTAPEVDEQATYSVMFEEHSTELYHEDTWVIMPWALETYNIVLDMQPIPASDFATKMSTVLASQELPDLLMRPGRDVANEYGELGMFVNLYEHKDVLPNMFECADKFPIMNTFMYFSDDKIYIMPTNATTDGAVNMCAYYIMFMRRDIMNELGIKDMPTTFDELKAIFVAMKEKYPDAYPWINRQNFDMILNVFAPGLGITCSPKNKSNTGYAVWKEDQQKFTSIMDEANFKWFLGWMNELYNEGLLDPNYAADDTATWQDKLDNSKGFFSVDYFSRPDTMTGSGSKITEGFELEAFQTPALEGGVNKVFTDSGISQGVVVSADTADVDRFLVMLDHWYYTEEGSLLGSYGVENVNFVKNADGTLSKIYTADVQTSLDFDAAYGVNYMSFTAFKPDFFGYDLYDPNQTEIYNKTWDLYKDGMIEKCPTIMLNPEQTASVNEYKVDMETTLRNIFNEFIIGRRVISDDSAWDAAIDELKNAGYNDWIDMMNEAYAG